MELLEERILADGKVYPGKVLKVDSFLNHQIDVPFVTELSREIYNKFKNCGVTKILTIEASGIGLACLTAQFFGCPVVFAKKSKTSNISDNFYSAEVYSYTHGEINQVIVSKEYLCNGDLILIIDDFLAYGNSLDGLRKIVDMAGALVVGVGIAVEKAFQGGGDKLRDEGIDLLSLAIVESMDDGKIVFREQ